MKKNHYITTALLAVSTLLYSCKKDFLDVQTVVSGVTPGILYGNYTYAQYAVWNVYSYLPDGFGSKIDFEGASDNAENTQSTDPTQAFNLGSWNQYSNPDGGSWANNFNGIQQANLFLKNRYSADISYIKNGITTTDSTAYFNARDNKRFWVGQVFFLKAYFYFELAKRYGGLPLFDQPTDYNNPASYKGIPRASLDATMKYISGLCDSALSVEPSSGKTYLPLNSQLSSYTWYDAGRVTQGAVLALKAKVLLYAASPAFTATSTPEAGGSTTTWAQAAAAAHAVMALGTYKLDASYSNLFGSSNSSSAEFIWYRRYGAYNTLEYNNYPIIYQNANGNSTTPTENLVSDFEAYQTDANGVKVSPAVAVPFDWTNAAMAANPYANRDPRLAVTAIVNETAFKAPPATTIETFTGGNSGLPKVNASRTGYYLGKYVNQTVDLVNATTTNHTWSYIRYGEILLDYAEAMFNAYGPTNDPMGYGMTALQAINNVRARSSMPAITADQLTQTRIEHERNVELSFEDERYWDVRRWKKGGVYLNVPVKRIQITANANNTFTYAPTVLETRVFDESKMYWYPIPQNDLTKTSWAQNPNW